MKLRDIIEHLGGELIGNEEQEITAIGSLNLANESQISFLANPKLQNELPKSRAACVIVSEAMREIAKKRGSCIITNNPYLYYARLSQLWKKIHQPSIQGFIHPSSVIDPSATIATSAYIGPLCVVEKGAVIGEYTVLKSHITIAEYCTIGSRCIIHPGVVIGADGFGLASHQGTWEKIEQLGRVLIGNDVEIGANTCIDRGALDDTIIEDGVKLDNLIQIAHNVRIGQHTAIAACTGIAGSTEIGAHCTIGGAAAIIGHLTLADGVHISAATTITKSLRQRGVYTGVYPFEEKSRWEHNAAIVKQLHSLRERIKCLEKKMSS